MEFIYTGVDKTGIRQKGKLEANNEQEVICEKITECNDNFCVNRHFLTDFLKHYGEARNNQGKHEHHHDYERQNDERRIDERILCFLRNFVVSVHVVRQKRERLVKFSRFFSRPHHVYVKRREYFFVARERRRDG